MFDIRYHIASLVAVFLALTVGLLLGSLIIDSSTLTKRQEKLMASINEDIKNIRRKNSDLSRQVRQLQTFKNKIWPAAVKDRLTNRKFLLVSISAHQDELFKEVSGALGKAGAQAAHLKIDDAKLDFNKNDFIIQTQPSLGTTTTTSTFESIFWRRLSEEISGRQPLSLVTNLSSRGIISLDDQSVLPVDGVIVAASPKSGRRDYDVKLLRACKTIPDFTVIGAETSDLRPSRMPAYQLQSVSTIDDIDTVPGWLSLVYLFEQRNVKADFGVKSTADKLMPD